MTILLIETATTTCGVGLMVNGVAEGAIVDRDRNHTECLTDGIERLLVSHDLTPQDLARVVVDRGPGLYTGLRVGIATAIGLANGLGIDLVGITSLEMIARGAFDSGVRGELIALIDGRRGEVFAQHFTLSNSVNSVADPIVVKPQDVARAVESWSSINLWGDGVSRYLDVFEGLANATLQPLEIPPLEAGLHLGAEASAVETIIPLYLRDPDAVANFTTREQRG
jgi:tRNA threonylcarbamoyladenosine biosynthesis protein TsaB